MASTLRLPEDLDAQLGSYCARVGAVKTRVVVLALRSYLGDGPTPALPLQPPDEPFAHEIGGDRAA
jgi:hypothetical protein